MTAGPGLRQRPSLRQKPLQKLIPRLKVAHVLGLSEENFGNLILSVEKDPLFLRFLRPQDPGRRLFKYQRFPQSDLSGRFMELKEEIAPSAGGVDVESLLGEKREIIDLCRRIGEEKFRSFFLYNEGGGSLEEVGASCGLSVEETRRLMDLVNQVGVHAEFYDGENKNPATAYYTRVAELAAELDGKLSLKFTSLRYARGRYVIDYDRLKSLDVSKDEVRRLKNLIKTMELINARRSTLHRILDMVLEKQAAYIRSGRPEDMTDLTQQDLAKILKLHGSTVCRAVAAKSILTPWNEEIPLKSFLIRGSLNGVLSRLGAIVSEEEEKIRRGEIRRPYGDKEIRRRLHADHGINIALRTVVKYRGLLNIPNAYTRAEPSAPRS